MRIQRGIHFKSVRNDKSWLTKNDHERISINRVLERNAVFRIYVEIFILNARKQNSVWSTDIR